MGLPKTYIKQAQVATTNGNPVIKTYIFEPGTNREYSRCVEFTKDKPPRHFMMGRIFKGMPRLGLSEEIRVRAFSIGHACKILGDIFQSVGKRLKHKSELMKNAWYWTDDYSKAQIEELNRRSFAERVVAKEEETMVELPGVN